MTDKILIPLDNSDSSRQTVQTLIANRQRFPLPLTLLHVIDLDQLAYRMIPDFQVGMVKENAMRAGEHFLAEQHRLLLEAGLQVETRLEQGSPRETISRIANEEEYQLLIIGRRTMGEIRDILFGSVTNYIMHKVKCPVLLL